MIMVVISCQVNDLMTQEALMCQSFGALVARQQVFDPPVWCEAALSALCRRLGDPHPS